jgi:hypothetical protein
VFSLASAFFRSTTDATRAIRAVVKRKGLSNCTHYVNQRGTNPDTSRAQTASRAHTFSSGATIALEKGVQFLDVNGDGLSDMLYGWADVDSPPGDVYNCVYLNTGLTVKQFVADVANSSASPRAAPW